MNIGYTLELFVSRTCTFRLMHLAQSSGLCCTPTAVIARQPRHHLLPMKRVPRLSKDPTHLADCCTSLSAELISTLVAILPRQPALALSVGSGTGLLEALIMRQCPDIRLQVTEVSETVNQYLPRESLNIVYGTWALCALAGEAAAWMFVYPRQASLLQNYIIEYGKRAVVTIVWLGPRVDFAEHREVFEQLGSSWTIEIAKDCGISTYEILAVWRKQAVESSGA